MFNDPKSSKYIAGKIKKYLSGRPLVVGEDSYRSLLELSCFLRESFCVDDIIVNYIGVEFVLNNYFISINDTAVYVYLFISKCDLIKFKRYCLPFLRYNLAFVERLNG